MSDKKHTKGGKRAGAGRPATAQARRVALDVLLNVAQDLTASAAARALAASRILQETESKRRTYSDLRTFAG